MTALLMLAFAVPATTMMQPPGVTTAIELTVQDVYRDMGNVTETWVLLRPPFRGASPNPTRLVFSVTREGKSPRPGFTHATIYAQSDLRAHPLTVRQQTLQFQWPDGAVLDLTGPGRTFHLNFPCNTCAFDAVIADISRDELRVLSNAAALGGSALGFDFDMTPEQLAALRTFRRAVE